MKILITGGLGYVGGRLAQHFIKHYPQYELYVSTTRQTFPDWTKACQVCHLNLEDEATIMQCVADIKPQIIIHCAALQQPDCLQNPDKAQRINVDGTREICKAALLNKVQRLIYMSTFQVYGVLKDRVTEASTIDPNNAYSCSKFGGEKVIHDLLQHTEVETLIFRLSNGFGVPADSFVSQSTRALVFNAFCRTVARGEDIHIRSNQYRNFISLTDVTAAIAFFLTQGIHQWQDGVFNLGGEACLSILDVARKVNDVYTKRLGGKSVAITVPQEEGQYQPFIYDVSKLKSSGFVFMNNDDEEIEKTLKRCMSCGDNNEE